MLCGKRLCQKGFNLILFSYKIVQFPTPTLAPVQVSSTLNSRVSRDQIFTAEGPKVNQVR